MKIVSLSTRNLKNASVASRNDDSRNLLDLFYLQEFIHKLDLFDIKYFYLQKIKSIELNWFLTMIILSPPKITFFSLEENQKRETYMTESR